MIEGHGDDIYAYGDSIRHNFSSNILSGVSHAGLSAHLGLYAVNLGSYPEPQPLSLEKILAEKLGVPPENVMVTNGATEAIYVIAHTYTGAVSRIVVPTFSEYEDACRLYGHAVSFVDSPIEKPIGICRDWDERCGNERSCFWICNPNNPTGKVMDKKLLKRLADENPATVHIIDQAYSDYTSKPVLDVSEAVDAENIVLLGSFTKRFSVPGLRVGYAVGCRKLMDDIKRFRMPWSVSSPAIEGAKYLLGHTDDYKIDCVALHSEAVRLAAAFRKIGIEVADTDCNFILCRLPNGFACDLKKWLVGRYGILIRDASNFHGLTASHFRVAAQSREENDLLISAVREWVAQ